MLTLISNFQFPISNSLLLATCYLLLGLIVGSFINVLLYRLDRKKGIMLGRSECLHCGHLLSWYDLVPLISFALLRGRCRYCKNKISWQYPIVELTTGLLFALFIFFNPPLPLLLASYYLLLIFSFIALFFFDLKYRILPDKIIFPVLALSVAYLTFFNRSALLGSALCALGLAGFFGIIYVATRGRGMGFGDVKMELMMGFALGYPVALFTTIVGIWLAAISGILLMIFKRAGLKTELPLGSFLAIASIFFIIFGSHLPSLIQNEIYLIGNMFK